MVDLTNRQTRDVVLLRGLNRSYAEIASRLNDKYGLSLSDGQVGDVVRDLEAQSNAAGSSPEAVFNEVVMHGYLDDVLAE